MTLILALACLLGLFAHTCALNPIDITQVTTFSGAVKGIQISSNETLLFSRDGPGVITQQWFTGDLVWPTFGNTRIRIYIDGVAQPALDFRLLMAMGVGFDQPVASPWGEDMLGATALSGGLYNTFRIPFSSGFRITATLDEGEEPHGFYYIVRGLLNTPVLFGDYALPPNARLTLQTLDNYLAQPFETVTIFSTANLSFPVQNATGGGCVLLVTLAAQSANLKYLEGRVRVLLDGEAMDLSSGTEDYFLSGQYFDLGVFHTPLSGCTIMDRAVEHKFSAYKFHIRDPVVWTSSFDLTWDIGDDLHKDTYETTMTSYVWSYVW